MWFDDLGDVVRVVAVGVAAYVALVVVLRVSGKRTLAKLNAFDLVVTVAFGSVLATALLSRTASLAEVATAFVVLAAAQFVVAALAVRVRSAGRLVRAQPTALVVRGQVDRSRLVAERVSMADLRAALRQAGLASVEDALVVVLETDGSLSIVPSGARAGEALDDVRGWRPAPCEPDDDGTRRDRPAGEEYG